jgi:hypothetical protein
MNESLILKHLNYDRSRAAQKKIKKEFRRKKKEEEEVRR